MLCTSLIVAYAVDSLIRSGQCSLAGIARWPHFRASFVQYQLTINPCMPNDTTRISESLISESLMYVARTAYCVCFVYRCERVYDEPWSTRRPQKCQVHSEGLCEWPSPFLSPSPWCRPSPVQPVYLCRISV